MNRLATETSPYLLQHAGNPVDWYPWGEEALARARAEDKPILLSIGYAACHWCHVMERESFEDPTIAATMNERFINVKVDREERPDLDSIYMTAVQAMTGHGGWPMTVFCTPTGEPFWGGTYFPPEDHGATPSFRRVLDAIDDAWRTKRDDIDQQGAALLAHIQRTVSIPPATAPLDEQILHDATAGILGALDAEWGGFGGAPKFPQPMTLEFLLRMHLRGMPQALDAVVLTLTKMARGGIFDHLAGGFARYSTDRIWLVPHFEKMLYDNAQLLRLYARAWQVTGDPLFEAAARRTIDWLLTEMRLPGGGFAASLDADSEGEEGRFYVWDYQELIEVAGDDVPTVIAAFALAGSGNWEGKTVLWRPSDDEQVATDTGQTAEQVRATVERVRARLLDRRAQRVRPAIDDKVLAAWNGMTIAALAEAGRVFDRPDAITAAVAACRFIADTLIDATGRLSRSWRGRTSVPGYLEDHAALADAALTLYETTFDPTWFRLARRVADDLLDLFVDPTGGFFDTGSDAPALVVRPKDLFDNAVPSGGSAAADVLLRLGALTGDDTYRTAALSFLQVVREGMARSPLGFGNALCALDRALAGATEVAIVGTTGRTDLLDVIRSTFRPNLVLAVSDGPTTEPALLEGRAPREDGRAVASVCQNMTCSLPVVEPNDLAYQLAAP